MSGRLNRGAGGGKKVFLSAHRCPEVDLLPQHDHDAQIPPLSSLVPTEKSSELTCPGKREAHYLDICSPCFSRGAEEDDDGSISDWSEEDLSLHFSSSVILQSDDEESDPGSGFECVDVTMETQVNAQEGEGQKMVPKRQIQLKKKQDSENVINQGNTEKLQVMLKDEPAEEGGGYNNVSADELVCPSVCQHPNMLLRQHSMPASFHSRSVASSDVDGYRVYKGLIAGASQGLAVGGSSRRLQKSLSLDETKTKMASCLIKNVLSKKMQVEQTSSNPSHLKKTPEVLPVLPAELQGGRTGVFKAPVHVVRDMRSLVKNTYSLSFPTTTPGNNQPTSFKVIGQEDSPPPTYQQAVGFKGHVAKVAASFSQSQNRKHNNTFSCPATQQRRGSEPIMSRRGNDDITWPVMLDLPTTSPVSSDLSELSQSERAGKSHPHPPPPPRTQLPLCDLEQSSILYGSSLSAPGSSQQVLQPCFYTPTVLPTFSHSLYPHLGKVNYIHGPLSYSQTQLQLPPPAPRTTGATEGHGNAVTPAMHGQQQQQQQQQQHRQQQPFLCKVQGFLPAQVGGDFIVDIAQSAPAPEALFSVPGPCHLVLDPKSGQCFYVDPPPQPQKKMLLDPETGQFIQVFLPGASSASNITSMLPGRCTNPAPIMIKPAPAGLQVGGANPTMFSVIRLPPPLAVSSLYGPPCLPLTVMTSHLQHHDDITPTAP
ncbi:uncharacterized protein LOC103374001 [Stegastes partitus]|uniref:Uncharacterized protein LOC103374001 n=1 Tax=Stegastes partitus TaxID=144197 RepID=A0A9Y4NRK1_9TELE|nr:PREDICTED: uncharacterized protein LOC103374001 [Stegastes partitus]